MSEQIDMRAELLVLLDREPFVPFTIIMASGDRYEVTDPHSAAVGQTTVIVVPPRGVGHSILRFNQVSAIDVLAAA